MITLTKSAKLIYESSRSFIYYQKTSQYNAPIIIKMLKPDYPTPQQIVQFNNEYTFTKDLNINGIRRSYQLTQINNKPALILEYFDGQPINQAFSNTRPSLSDFLKIAIRITQILSNIHQHNIIHKDINSNNILINTTHHTIKIIDFGISSRLSTKIQHLGNPNILEGTLPYISPEQTGRMNRIVDYRTDLYSLGITFYELLTGTLPFVGQDNMALIHSHIAKQPTPIIQINPNIPHILAEIIQKLMAKNAEDRYQSAHGLQTDLKKCLTQYQQNNTIHPFPLMKNDSSSKFQIPQKLYGREQEIETLLAAFNRISTPQRYQSKIQNLTSKIEMMLVAGYSGVGKSSLINEIHKPITAKRGYFISGKYDQYQRNVPYTALLQAFNEFVNYLLTEDSNKLESWAEKIKKEIGTNGQVLIEVIPNLELIIGKQPPVPELGPQENQNRFNTVFQNFIKAISQKNHPLVLFVDDLQWADVASLNLLKVMMTDTKNKYFLIIGAYRNNEVDASHPLMLTLANIKAEEAIVHTLTLNNLAYQHVTEFIADTLHCSHAQIEELAELVYQKTHGNAFFVTQFLKTLDEEDLLTFNFEKNCWMWDIQHIRQKSITDNVVELMANKIQKLSPQTQKILTLAACIGNNFNLEILAIIYERNIIETLQHLWQAIEEGLVIPVNDNYRVLLTTQKAPQNTHYPFKFLHDRVQQAAYSFIHQVDRKAIHLKIGRLLLQNIEADDLEENIFDIINHFNMSLELISSSDNNAEKLHLAELNLMAGQKAKEATAYLASTEYLSTALQLLPPNAWTTHYQLTYNIHITKAESEYLQTNFDETLNLFNTITTYATNNLDLARIYDIIIILHTNLGEMVKAVAYGKKAITMLGVDLPDNTPAIRTMIADKLKFIQSKLDDINVESLVDLPEMKDPEKIALMNILVKCVPPAYQTDQNMVAIIITTMVETSLNHGNAVFSSYGYDMYAILVGSLLKNYPLAYQLGKVAITLVNKFNDITLKGAVYFVFGNFVSHWGQPLRESLKIFKEGFQGSIEGGDHIHTGYCASRFVVYSLLQGVQLDKIYSEALTYTEFLEKKKDLTCTEMTKLAAQMILLLKGKTESLKSFDGNGFSETTFIETFKENLFSLSHYYVLKLITAYLFENYSVAYELLPTATNVMHGSTGSTVMAAYNFYHSLILINHIQHLLKNKTTDNIDDLIAQIESNQQEMKIWADSCSENYLHKYTLIEAEKAALENKNFKAIGLYDEAIDLAKKQQFIQEAALANELATRFYLANNMKKIAALYLKEAYYLYNVWGATAKAKMLEDEFRHLLSLNKFSSTLFTTTQTAPNTTFGSHSTTDSTSALDIVTIIKASQAISSQIDLDKVLTTLIKIIIENAGAQRGCLVLVQEDQLLVQAEGEIDQEKVNVLQSIPITKSTRLSPEIVNYVARTHHNLVLNNASQEGDFTETPYILATQPKSILCTPLIHHGKLKGLFYLENNLTTNAFTAKRVELIKLLGTQATISIRNAQAIANRTEQERLRLANEFLEKQSAELSKLNANKDRFFSIVAHDLKSPFHPLLALSKLLTDKNRQYTQEEVYHMGDSIYQAAQSIYRLLENLLAWSRIQRGLIEYQPSILNLNEIVEGNIKLLATNATDKQISLHSKIAKEIFLYADENMLDTILRNLISNAIKFTPKGGHVIISAQLATPHTPNKNSTAPTTNFAEISVTDTGLGIEAENLEKLFKIDTHHSTLGTAQEKGTGLGLILCQEMVSQNGGKIWAESTLGKGTTIKFTMPLDKSTSPTAFLNTETQQTNLDLINVIDEAVKQTEQETLIPPPLTDLNNLLDLAMRGNMKKIKAYVTTLEQENSQFIPFAQKIKQLVKTFDDGQIIALIENILEKTS